MKFMTRRIGRLVRERADCSGFLRSVADLVGDLGGDRAAFVKLLSIRRLRSGGYQPPGELADLLDSVVAHRDNPLECARSYPLLAAPFATATTPAVGELRIIIGDDGYGKVIKMTAMKLVMNLGGDTVFRTVAGLMNVNSRTDRRRLRGVFEAAMAHEAVHGARELSWLFREKRGEYRSLAGPGIEAVSGCDRKKIYLMAGPGFELPKPLVENQWSLSLMSNFSAALCRGTYSAGSGR